jgi:hypothetical protein
MTQPVELYITTAQQGLSNATLKGWETVSQRSSDHAVQRITMASHFSMVSQSRSMASQRLCVTSEWTPLDAMPLASCIGLVGRQRRGQIRVAYMGWELDTTGQRIWFRSCRRPGGRVFRLLQKLVEGSE